MKITQQNTPWVRYGVLSALTALGGLGFAVVACSDNAATSDATPTPDGGNVNPEIDSGSGGGDAAKPDFAKLTFVNAATDIGPNAAFNARGDAAIRLCFKFGSSPSSLIVAPRPPLPDAPSDAAPPGTPPGAFYGTGGVFPSFGLSLEKAIIVPIIMNAKTLAAKGYVNPGNGSPGTTCDELVGDTADGGAGLVANRDYWELAPIPAGTFKNQKSFVIVLTGCTGDATIEDRTFCGDKAPTGDPAPGVGNLAVTVFETARTPVATDKLGVQFIHASPQASAFLTLIKSTLPVAPGFTTSGTDSVSFKAATTEPAKVLTVSPALGVSGVKDTDFFAASKDTPEEVGVPFAPIPLSLVQQISGLPAPSIFVAGQNVVFIAVGDPTIEPVSFSDGTVPPEPGDGGAPAGDSGAADGGAADGGAAADAGDAGTPSFNTRSFHYLAFPTDPAVVQR